MSEQYNSAHNGTQIDEAVNKVLNDAPVFGGVVQALTEARQKQARANIGAVKSWSELADKPVVTEGVDTLTWNCDKTGLVEVDTADTLGFKVYKVSDAVPPAVSTQYGIVFSFWVEDVEEPVPLILVSEEDGICLYIGYGTFYVFVVTQDNINIEADEGVFLTFPEKGVYFMDPAFFESNFSITVDRMVLTVSGYTGFAKEVIDPAYLPRNLLYTDGLYLYKTSDITDASNRISKAELTEYAENNAAVKIVYLTSVGKNIFHASTIVLHDDLSYGYVICYTGDGWSKFYTAESTAS